MKPNFLSLLAIAASATAISINLSGPRPLTEAQIDERVNAVLAEKERATCEKYAPKVLAMYREMQAVPFEGEWKPKTYEDLLDPLVQIITLMNLPEVDGAHPPGKH